MLVKLVETIATAHVVCLECSRSRYFPLPIVAPFLLVVSARSRDIIPSLQLQSDRPARMSQLARESSHDTDEGVQVHESDQNDFYRIDTSGPPARYTGGCSRGRLATCTVDQGGLLFLRSHTVKDTL